MKKFLVLGGDYRQIYLADMLNKNGEQIEVYFDNDDNFSLEMAIEKSDIILCPVPFTKDKINIFSSYGLQDLKIEDFLNFVHSKHTVFGGNIPLDVRIQFEKRNIVYFDFMDMEEVSVKNAIATAEGAIAEGIRQSSINIHQSQCLVLGYGRCGKVLAQKLKALDAYVTVAGRNEQKLANATAFGMETAYIKTLEKVIGKFDFIFNTVPQLIIDERLIDLVKRDVLIIDIASAPGGVNFNYCKEVGIKADLCLGLPGRFSPKASADILFHAIMKLL